MREVLTMPGTAIFQQHFYYAYFEGAVTLTRVEIERDIKTSVGGSCWINRKDLAKYLGFDRSSVHVSNILKGLPKIGKKYAIKEVSERIFYYQES